MYPRSWSSLAAVLGWDGTSPHWPFASLLGKASGGYSQQIRAVQTELNPYGGKMWTLVTLFLLSHCISLHPVQRPTWLQECNKCDLIRAPFAERLSDVWPQWHYWPPKGKSFSRHAMWFCSFCSSNTRYSVSGISFFFFNSFLMFTYYSWEIETVRECKRGKGREGGDR